MHHAGVLLIENERTDAESFLSLARHFGILEVVHPPEHRLPGHDQIRLQSNIPGYGVAGGGTYWHADSPWYEPPSLATVLMCQEAPLVGGETLFVDMKALFADLPSDLREKINGRYGIFPCRKILQAELSAMDLSDPVLMEAVSDIRRSLVRKHPATGEQFLYLNEKWLTGIEGMSEHDSSAILQYLYSEVDSSRFRYTHKWRSGQILVWDNNRVLHKAYQPKVGCRKITWRAIVKSS